MTISATALSGPSATQLTRAATSAFLGHGPVTPARGQDPVKDRIQLRVVKGADEPKLVKPRSKALPMLVLLGGLIAAMADVFTRTICANSKARTADDEHLLAVNRSNPTRPSSAAARPARRWARPTAGISDGT